MTGHKLSIRHRYDSTSHSRRDVDLTLRRKTKKALALREGTKKGRRVAMPQADQNERIQADHPSQIGSTSHSRRDADDEGADGLYDEHP